MMKKFLGCAASGVLWVCGALCVCGMLGGAACADGLPGWTGGEVADWDQAWSAYQRDNLLVQWDGLNPDGSGTNDLTSTLWKNLASDDLSVTNDYDLFLTENGSWSNAWLNVADCSATGAVACTGYKMIEIVFLSTNDTGRCLFFSGSNKRLCMFAIEDGKQDRLVFISDNETYGQTIAASDLTTNVSVSAVYSDAGAVTGVYTNGCAVTEKSTEMINWGSDINYMMIGNRSQTSATYNGVPWFGRIYAIRLYEEPLDEAWMANHALLDRARFFGDEEAKKEILAKRFTVEAIPDQTYTGGNIKPTVVVRDAYTGATIGSSNYSLTWENNTMPGTATVTVTGLNTYAEAQEHTQTLTFNITAEWTGGMVDWESASAYQQKDLIAQWDGIDNVGTGTHVAETNTWVNLAPSDTNGTYNLTLTKNGSWGDNWLNVNNYSAIGKEGKYNRTYKTIEVVFRSTNDTGRCIFTSGHNHRIFAFNSDGNAIVLYTADSKKRKTAPADSTSRDDWSVAATYSSDNTPSSVYTNGLTCTATNGSYSWTSGYNGFMIGNRKKSNGDMPWYGRVYTIRLYSSALSAQQLYNHQLLDRARYFNDRKAISEIVSHHFTVDAIPAQPYLGTSCEPHPVVRDLATGDILTEGEDYSVEYADNNAPGTATLTITGTPGSNYAYLLLTETFEISHVMRVKEGGTGDGASWEDAMAWADALHAVDLSTTACEIWVAGNVAVASESSHVFTLPCAIRGGFAGTEAHSTERTAGARSEVNGNNVYNCLNFANTVELTLDGIYFTRGFHHGVRKTASVGDLVVTNCAFNANGSVGGTWSDKSAESGMAEPTMIGMGKNGGGGGANFIGSGKAVLTVVDCDFSGNTTASRKPSGSTNPPAENYTGTGGGALIASFAKATISDCTFATNYPAKSRSGWAAGLQLYEVPTRVSGCAFCGNAALAANGSAVNVYGANCAGTVFENCVFSGNVNGKHYAWGDGQKGQGEICFDMASTGAAAAVTNCTFAYNYARKSATFTVNAGSVDVRNAILWCNLSETNEIAGTEINCKANGRLTADWLVISGTNATYVTSATEGAVTLGEHVYTYDPMLVTTPVDFTNRMRVATMPYVGWTTTELHNMTLSAACTTNNVHLCGRYVDETTGAEVTAGERSWAVDAGDPDSDFYREPEPNGKCVDLGAYGNTPWATFSKRLGFLFEVK